MADRYWVGGNGNWNDTAHWSATDGGGGGVSAPTSADTAYFTTNSGSNKACTINVDAACLGLNHAGTVNIGQGANILAVGSGGIAWSAGTFTGGSKALTCAGAFSLTGGTFTCPTSATTFTLSGDFTHSGGTFTHNSGEIVFDSDTEILGTSTPTFYKVTISGTLTGKNGTMNVANNWANNGTFTHNSGTVAFTSNTTISGSSTTEFNNVTVTGTLVAPAGTIQVEGDFANNGTFTHSSGTVEFTGTSTISGSAAPTFYNVTITGTLTGHATSFNIARNLVNNGTYTHNSGTVVFNGTTTISGSSVTSFYSVSVTGTLTAPAAMNVAGNWSNTGTFTAGTGTVTMNGSGAQAFNGNRVSTFYVLEINKSGGTATINNNAAGADVAASEVDINAGKLLVATGAALDVNGSVYIQTAASSNLELLGTGTLNVTGNITVDANPTTPLSPATGSTVTMDGSGDQTIGGASTAVCAFGILTIANTGDPAATAITIASRGASPDTTVVTLNVNDGRLLIDSDGDITVSGSLTVASGAVFTASTGTLSVGGAFTNNGTFNHGSGTVTFYSATTAAIAQNITFYNLICATAGKQLTITGGKTLTISNDLTLTGTSGSKLLLRSSDTTKFTLTCTKAVQLVTCVDVSYSQCSTYSIVNCGGTNSGNTDAAEALPHWIFRVNNQLKRFVGAAWQSEHLQVYEEDAWVIKPLKRRVSTEWVPVQQAP